MKIGIAINADYGKELYLQENSDKLKSELLSVIEQFIGKNVSINFEQEDAQIDALTGEVVNYNPYPMVAYHMSMIDLTEILCSIYGAIIVMTNLLEILQLISSQRNFTKKKRIR